MTAWSDNPAYPGIPIRVVHIVELRSAVDDLREAADPPIAPGGWTDAPLTSTTGIKAVHFTELAGAIAQLWDQRGMGPLPPWSAPEGAPAPDGPIRASAINDLRSWVDAYDPPSLIGAMWTSASTDDSSETNTRNWNSKDGWDVELVYAVNPSPGFDAGSVGGRVQRAHAKGRNVLVRVDYQPYQSVPPDSDSVGQYFTFLATLAGLPAFQQPADGGSVFAFIIGNEFNSLGENQVSGTPLPASWYAAVFNGTGPDYASGATGTDQTAIDALKQAYPNANVLVGPVGPYDGATGSDDGTTFNPPAAWLEYYAEICKYVSGSAVTPNNPNPTPPDGFAIHAYGRTGSDGSGNHGAEEPNFPVPDPGGTGAQYGFRAFADWQSVINTYFGTSVAIYITETNTQQGNPTPPPDTYYCDSSYPSGWLLTALSVVYAANGGSVTGGQFRALCWFVDENYEGSDPQWIRDSLENRVGNCAHADDDFNQALQHTPY